MISTGLTVGLAVIGAIVLLIVLGTLIHEAITCCQERLKRRPS